MSDEELMAAVKAGDDHAFTVLYDRYWAKVCRGLMSKLDSRHKHKHEDLAQEVFVKIWRSRDTYNESEDFLPWLKGITQNDLFDFQRALNTQKREETKEVGSLDETIQSEDGGEIARIDLVASRGLTPEEMMMVNYCLNKLEKKERDALIECDCKGHTLREAGEKLGVSHVTVERHLIKARAKFKQCYEGGINHE